MLEVADYKVKHLIDENQLILLLCGVRLENDVLFVDVLPLPNFGDSADSLEPLDIDVAAMHHSDQRIGDAAVGFQFGYAVYLPNLFAVEHSAYGFVVDYILADKFDVLAVLVDGYVGQQLQVLVEVAPHFCLLVLIEELHECVLFL